MNYIFFTDEHILSTLSYLFFIQFYQAVFCTSKSCSIVPTKANYDSLCSFCATLHVTLRPRFHGHFFL